MMNQVKFEAAFGSSADPLKEETQIFTCVKDMLSWDMSPLGDVYITLW